MTDSAFSLQGPHRAFTFEAPAIMGVVNLHPLSFSHTGRYPEPKDAIQHALQLIREGADIIDIGAEPTNPVNDVVVTVKEELNLLMPVIKALRQESNIPISVDTSQPEVMQEVIAAGADIINDVRALRVPGALEMAAKLKAIVCLMHMTYPWGCEADTSSAGSASKNILQVVIDFLKERIDACLQVGISRSQIMIDPGIGAAKFGKTTNDNLTLLKHTAELRKLGFPLLLGVSRKLFIGELLNEPEENRLVGSIAAQLYAFTQGAQILRTHDVKAVKQALKIWQAIEDC